MNEQYFKQIYIFAKNKASIRFKNNECQGCERSQAFNVIPKSRHIKLNIKLSDLCCWAAIYCIPAIGVGQYIADFSNVVDVLQKGNTLFYLLDDYDISLLNINTMN